MRCDSQGELYPINPIITNLANSPFALAALAPSLWHDRLGHPRAPVFNSLRLNKFECTKLPSDHVCHSCLLGKHVQLPFVASNSCTVMPSDIIHNDIWTSLVLSSSGHRFNIILLDDYSNFLWTFPLSKKSQVFSTFLHFRAFIRTQFEREITNIQCDHGREFDNGLFWEFYKANGLSFRLSCPHTSSQNGKAERKIQTSNNILRTLLAHASLTPSFWHHALQMATYLLNILPSKKLAYKSPLQILYQKDPFYSHLWVFGCFCYPLYLSTTINKLQVRSTPCVFLGILQIIVVINVMIRHLIKSLLVTM